jgi:hypothetical protein
LSFATLQHIRIQAPFFSLLSKRSKRVAVHLESPALRVWLPFRRCASASNPWGPLSAPNALGLRPSELCSFKVIGNWLSQFLFRSGAFLPNLISLVPALQRLIPTLKAVSLSAPRGFSSGRDPLLSWASGLLGSPSAVLGSKRLSSNRPSRRFHFSAFTSTQVRDPRVCSTRGLAVSLRRGRRPIWPFSPTVVGYLFET